MTLTADGVHRHDDDLADRRRPARHPRRSWASHEPFVRRTTPHNAPGALTDAWSTVGRDYARTAAVSDVGFALVVGAASLLPTWGPAPSVALWAGAGALGFAALVLGFGGYRADRLGDGPGELQAVLRAGLVLAAVLMATAYLLKLPVPRLAVVVGIPLLVVLGLAQRHLHRRRLHRDRLTGTGMRRTLVVGDAGSTSRVVGDLLLAPHHGFLPIGVCLAERDAGEHGGVPVLGGLADVVQVVADHAVETVVVTGSQLSGDALRRLGWALGRAGAQMVVAPDMVEVSRPRLTVRPTAGLSLLEVEVGAPRSRLLMKSALDRTLGFGLLLVAAPVIGAAAAAVALTSPGGAFYRQQRVGLDGSTFTMWKLRSMYVDAEERRRALLTQSDRDGLMFKMREDPRVTRVGRVLRRFSIDELPQLFNVVRGDMSLVGPRPPLLSEVSEYADPVGRRLHVRPGLTGLWQVSGRADLSWDESVRLDLRYVDNWSVAMDLMILWKTGRAVVRGSGAY